MGEASVFEFDPEKSAANLAKHGIDFEAAQALWLDERKSVVLPPRPSRSAGWWWG